MSPSACPRCGTALAAGGVCPRCVLSLGLGGDSLPHEPALAKSQGSQRPGSLDPTTPPAGSSSRGPRFVAPSVAELAPRFPQLEILELLGQGGMGAVYKARQPGLDRLVAVKILPAETAADPSFAERFTREARALARLSHPQIVAVYDFGRAGDLYYFVMEYVEGANLRQLLRSGEMTAEQALAIVPQMCEALQFAHDEGVVHRDIKPENVLVDRRGRVKIADFGLAKLLLKAAADYTLTSPEQVMGTPHYMAPEQMERPTAVDHRADIYSLGVVFYELLTGELPLGRFSPPSEVAQVDARLDEVVLKSLAKEPGRRYQHASDVRTRVEAIRQSSPALPSPPVRTAQPEPSPAAVTAPWQTPSPSPIFAPTLPPKPIEEPIDWPTVEGAVRYPAIGLILLGIAYLVGPFLLASLVIVVPSMDRPQPKVGESKATAESWDGPTTMIELGTAGMGVPPAAPILLPPLLAQRAEARTSISWIFLGALCGLVVPITIGGLLILGGVRMLQLQAYGLAMIAAIIAVLTPVGAIGVGGVLFLGAMLGFARW